MSNLELYYKGDKCWKEFVAFYSKQIDDPVLLNELKGRLNSREDIAIVILGIFRNGKNRMDRVKA